MNRVLHLVVSVVAVGLLLIASGFQLDYKKADAWFNTNVLSSFTPVGYSTLAATNVTSSVALSNPQSAVIAVITNLGPNLAYVNLGSSTVTATTTGAYPIVASGVAVLTTRNSTHMAGITATGTANLSVVTGY